MSTPIPAVKIVAEEEGQHYEVLGSPLSVKLCGHDTQGSLALMEYALLPGEGMPPRIHAEEDVTLYVVNGHLELQIAEKSVSVTTGAVVYLPRNTVHSFQAANNRPCRLLLIITPAGLELCFREYQRLVDPCQDRWEQV